MTVHDLSERRPFRRRALDAQLTQTQPQIVTQTAVGSGVVIGPAALVHFLIEELEPQHRSGGTSDEYLLGKAERPAKLSSELLFAMPKVSTFPRTAVDGVADRPATNDPRMRAETLTNLRFGTGSVR